MSNERQQTTGEGGRHGVELMMTSDGRQQTTVAFEGLRPEMSLVPDHHTLPCSLKCTLRLSYLTQNTTAWTSKISLGNIQ